MANYNTAGVPAAAFPLTGNEMIAADSGLAAGSGLAQVAISSAQVHLFATAPLTLPYAAALTLDGSQSNSFKVTLTGNATLAMTNLPAGRVIRLEVTQDGTGGRTLTYPANVRWPGGTAPTLSGANQIDVLTFFNDGTRLLGTSALNYAP